MKEIIEYIDYLIENSTSEKTLWNIEMIKEKKPMKWNYIDGIMLFSILNLYNQTKNEKYFYFVKSYVDSFIDENGIIKGYRIDEYNLDNINSSKVLFFLYEKTKDDKYKKALELTYEQIKTQPRINAGNFWHKKVYPNQVWLDGLYMAQPFYLEYELKFNDGIKIEDSLSQFKFVYENMKDEKTNLLYHGIDESKEMFWANKITGLSQNFWLRSLGWYMMALVDSIEVLQKYGKEISNLGNYLNEVAEAILNYKSKENLYYQVVDKGDKEGNYLETSGSCMVAYAMIKGSRIGILDEKFATEGKRTFEAIEKTKMKIANNVMHLKDICLVAGLGGMQGMGDYKLRDGSYEYYISEPVVENDAKGVAPFVLAFTEYLKQF